MNTEEIKDNNLNNNLLILFNDLKYYSIRKNMNGIYFMKHSGKSFEQGLVYSIDGEKPNSLYIKIDEFTLISDNWYYYMGS